MHAWLSKTAAVISTCLACSGCAGTAPACKRSERISLAFAPDKALNQDRDGYPRSLVLRVYQLDAAEPFRQVTFDEIWRVIDDGKPTKPVVAGPDELTLIPGQRERRWLPREPSANYVAVVANFREHEPGSGWQAIAPLPEPANLCVRDTTTTAAYLDVALRDYGLHVRERIAHQDHGLRKPEGEQLP